MKSLQIVSSTKLPCIETSQAPIILCLIDSVSLVSTLHTMPAFLITSEQISDGCAHSCEWRYTISYDETLLLDPETLLLPTDIAGVFCESCFTDWIKEYVAQAILEAS